MQKALENVKHFVCGFVLPSVSPDEIVEAIDIWQGSTVDEIFAVIDRQKFQHVPPEFKHHYKARVFAELQDMTFKRVQVINPMEPEERQAMIDADNYWKPVPRYKTIPEGQGGTPTKSLLKAAMGAVNV